MQAGSGAGGAKSDGSLVSRRMLLSSGPGTVPELVVAVVSVAAVLPVPVGGCGGFGFGRGDTST